MSKDPAVDKAALAARIGGRYVRNCMFVGIVLAALILVLIDGGDPGSLYNLIMDWPVQAFVILIIGPILGHLVGAWSGKKILLHGWSAWLVTPCVGLGCVWTTTFLFSVVGYFQEGIHGWDREHAVRDYIFNPMLSVTLFGGFFIFTSSLILAALFQDARRKHFNPGR